MSGLNYIRFSDRHALIGALAETSQNILGDAVSAAGKASLLCSGGSTPGPLYSALSNAELDWANITVGLTDERWVAPTSEGSNLALIERTLMQNHAKAAALYPMVTDPALSAFDEAHRIDATYKQHLLPADLMILGMGADAHTLSWFAGGDGLDEALDPETAKMVTAIEAPATKTTGAYTTRQTLTRPAIAAARNVFLMLTGDEKRIVFENSTPDSPVGQMIEAAGDRLTTYWAP